MTINPGRSITGRPTNPTEDSMCNNFETYYVPRGYDYRRVQTRCGNTKTDGSRAICDTCAADPERMREIETHERQIAADNAASRSAGWGDW